MFRELALPTWIQARRGTRLPVDGEFLPIPAWALVALQATTWSSCRRSVAAAHRRGMAVQEGSQCDCGGTKMSLRAKREFRRIIRATPAVAAGQQYRVDVPFGGKHQEATA